jgi:hypothetical protein
MNSMPVSPQALGCISASLQGHSVWEHSCSLKTQKAWQSGGPTSEVPRYLLTLASGVGLDQITECPIWPTVAHSIIDTFLVYAIVLGKLKTAITPLLASSSTHLGHGCGVAYVRCLLGVTHHTNERQEAQQGAQKKLTGEYDAWTPLSHSTSLIWLDSFQRIDHVGVLRAVLISRVCMCENDFSLANFQCYTTTR